MAFASGVGFIRSGFRSLYQSRRRLNKIYSLEKTGDYKIFRETVSRKDLDDQPVILIVGFRLKMIKSSPLLHRFFQRVCVLTTPFWSGLAGFKIKLWMVNRETKDYLGVYEWLGEKNARRYVEFLLPILGFFSIKKTIWHKIYYGRIEDYLADKQLIKSI